MWLFFVLKDRERLPSAVERALPEGWRPDARNVMALFASVGGRWVRGQLVLGAAIFVATVIGLTILTLIGFGEFGEFTLVLALIAGVLEWFPIIGPIIASVPAILIGLSISPAAALAAVVLYTAIQQLENNLLVPKVIGDAVKLHPAVMILALVAGGALFGIGGAILAAPTVAIGRDLYQYAFRRLHGDSPELAFAVAGPGDRQRSRRAGRASFARCAGSGRGGGLLEGRLPGLHPHRLQDAHPEQQRDHRRAAVGDERERDAGDRHDPDHHPDVHHDLEEQHAGQAGGDHHAQGVTRRPSR